jgi:hypothetical protein
MCVVSCAFAQAQLYDHYGRGLSEPDSMDATSQDLREQLARERYKTEIALERAKRERILKETQQVEYINRQREIEYKRMEQERKNRETQDDLLNINTGLNVIINLVRSLEVIRTARF